MKFNLTWGLCAAMICNLCTLGAMGQTAKPRFGPPLDIPLYLSGNFAELRRNHFHMGLDIKTLGVEGQRVIAAEEGRVSRISISPAGYGNALYIEHPNGYTTVYAHLKSFSPAIDAVAKKEQYARQSFAVDFQPADTVRVALGEFIALSGNTGSSGGAHLHFEIRDTRTNRAMNPLLFGFDIQDNIPPRIRGLRFHPLSDSTLINGKHEAVSLVVEGDAGKYRIKAGQKVRVYGAFGVSIHAIDMLNGQSNKCGIYSAELEVDGKIICKQQLDAIDYAYTRHINCYKDYESFKNKGWHYHKSWKEPGNGLDVYTQLNEGMGVLAFPSFYESTEGNKTLKANYIITDAYENTSRLPFEITILPKADALLPAPRPYDAWFFYNQDNSFEYIDELSIRIPAGALYNDLAFQFGWEMRSAITYTPHYQVHRENVPIDKFITLEFNIAHVPQAVRGKLVAARFGDSGGPAYLNGKVDGDRFMVQSRDFGKYTLMADSTPPLLSARRYTPGMALGKQSVQDFTIDDGMSGIKHHGAWLNGEWVLMEYDQKNRRLWLQASGLPFAKGRNTLKIRIEDHCGNITEQEYNYTW